MIGAGPPVAVRRYRHKPLRLVSLGVLLCALFSWSDVRTGREVERGQREFPRLTAKVVLPEGNGGPLRVSYVHPSTEQRVKVVPTMWSADLPDPGEPVRVIVSPDDPDEVFLADDHYPTGENLIGNLLVLAGIPAVWWLLRGLALWRVRRFVEGGGVAFAMVGAIAPRPRWSRAPVLHLYPVDAAPGAEAVCAVPLLTTLGCPVDVTLPVEVKGVPRPLGRVVAVVGSSDRLEPPLLWPKGRANFGSSLPRPVARIEDTGELSLRAVPAPHRVAVPAWWTELAPQLFMAGLAIGLAALVAADTLSGARSADALEARAVDAIGTVVDHGGDDDRVVLTYRLPGESLKRRAAAPADYASDYPKGRKYPLRVDRQDPASIRLAAEPYDAVEPILWGAAPLAIVAGSATARARQRRRHVRLLGSQQWRVAHAWSLRDAWDGTVVAVGPLPRAPSVVMVVRGHHAAFTRSPRPVAVAGELDPGADLVIAVDCRAVVAGKPPAAPGANDVQTGSL